ncbi:MAG TPA: hypothetical protein VKR80_00740 [Candidatus Limnocylindria bacterium]|nr:hypothetical protein [Candidatus Limnocylindria bacterium]
MTKDFSLGGFLGNIDRARRETDKCYLLCANCHRARHARAKSDRGHPVTRFRQNMKRRALTEFGGACGGCGLRDPADALEFHHVDATAKEFALSVDGVPRSWARVRAELAKCVLLSANCHRETHAGVRSVGDGTNFAEAPGCYRVFSRTCAA